MAWNYCKRCIYRDRNNDKLVCSLPRCALSLRKGGVLVDRLTGDTVRTGGGESVRLPFKAVEAQAQEDTQAR